MYRWIVLSLLLIPFVVEAADCTSTLANLNANQTEVLRRIARQRCRGIKEASPGTTAPYGFTNEAACGGAPTVTQMQDIVCDLGLLKLQNDASNLNDADGRELQTKFSTLSKATRDEIKALCGGDCTFLGE